MKLLYYMLILEARLKHAENRVFCDIYDVLVVMFIILDAKTRSLVDR
jgi:hypothetical protein